MLDNLQIPGIGPDSSYEEVFAALSQPGTLFEVEEQRIRGSNYKVFKNQPSTLKDILFLMLSHGDADFMVYGEERYSFSQALDKTARLAQYLVDDMGLRKGDRVALAMRNYPEWPIAYMAIVAAGGVACLLNAWWLEEELDWALRDCGAKLLIADQVRFERCRRSVDELGLKTLLVRSPEIEHPLVNHLTDTLLGDKVAMTFPPVDLLPEDYAHMLYTSGSTGFPKGAVSDHRAVVGVLMTWVCLALYLKLTAEVPFPEGFQPSMLVTIPFFHVTGLLPVLMVSAVIGRKIVIMHKWDVEDAFRWIEREKITSMTGVPTMSYELASSPLIEKYDVSTLKDLGGGGAARPKEHVRLIREKFENSKPGLGYGLTETNSLGTVISGPDYLDRPTSAGIPTPPLVDIKIVDPDGTTLPTGERGEIYIKSIVNVREYWGNPEATAAAFQDGWFHTGDVGYVDADGFLYIVDRLKDIIIRGGENISTLEVEAVLHAMPGVQDVMVFGLPDERLGEIVGAVIVTESVTVDAAKAEAAKHLAAFKLPEHIWIQTEALPHIASGKIDRKGIREHFLKKYQG